MPSGIDARTQLNYSCLVDAYRLSELNPKNNLLVHRMAAGLIDEAVPLECLLTTVWSIGWPQSEILLSLEEAQKYIERPVKTGQKNSLVPLVAPTSTQARSPSSRHIPPVDTSRRYRLQPK